MGLIIQPSGVDAWRLRPQVMLHAITPTRTTISSPMPEPNPSPTGRSPAEYGRRRSLAVPPTWPRSWAANSLEAADFPSPG